MVTYTCPMHLEIVSAKPGRCLKCGMVLVAKDERRPVIHMNENEGLEVITWKSYVPLTVIIALIIVASAIVSSLSLQNFLISFMTGFFLVFTGFKLMDLKGFAEGYSTYDLLAQKWFGYGYAYPFIELAFGLLMLSGYHPAGLLWTEFCVMTFSGLGVAIKITKKEPFMCACLGTFFRVPLTHVTLIEDFGMALLALMLIFFI